MTYGITRPWKLVIMLTPKIMEKLSVHSNVIIGGFNENASIDTKGPEIDLYLTTPASKPGI